MANNRNQFAIAVDIGGTFTDVVIADRDKNCFFVTKTSSTPLNPADGFFNAVESALKLCDANPEDVKIVFHGSTVATNAILESKGAKTALLTTKGFRHVLDIGRAEIPREANLYGWVKPKRPVQPRDVFEVDERVRSDGSVAQPINKNQLEKIVKKIADGKYEAVAISLLHSYLNADHEKQIYNLLAERFPNLEISISSDVLPVFREYERSMATIMNVMVQPLVGKYIRQLEEGLAEKRIKAPLFIMKSNGGVFSPQEAARSGAHMALSGPAAGTNGAANLGRLCKIEDIITIDIGGTSADISLIRGGKAEIANGTKINDLPLSLAVTDIHTIGAGGGSIARISGNGAIMVGPASAGADPGPVAYGKGGIYPTVTDANLVLGRLPEKLLDGALRLDSKAASFAIKKYIADPLGTSVEAAAIGILAIVNETMNNALKLMTVERGLDPKNYTLIAFGGAGPVHGGQLMRLLQTEKLLIPRYPGILCATGLLSTDLRYDFAITRLQRAGEYNKKEISETFNRLSGIAKAKLKRDKIDPAQCHLKRGADVRYAGQGTELSISFADGAITSVSIERAVAEFHRTHKELYNFSDETAPVEFVNFRITAIGAMNHIPQPKLPQSASVDIPATDYRQVVFDMNGPQRTPVWRRKDLLNGHQIVGPAIIDQLDTTSIIYAGQRAKVDEWGNILVSEVML